MKFFAVHIADLESDRFASATGDQIAAWLFLHALCSKQRNSGIIKDARGLGARFWGRHGIDPAVVGESSPLWRWEGGDLILEPYDIEGQALAEKKSEGGRAGAQKRWNRSGPVSGAADGSPNATPDASPNGTPIGTPNGSPDRSPKGSPNASPNGSAYAPYSTLPNSTQPVPEPTRETSFAPDGTSSDPKPEKIPEIAWSGNGGFSGIRSADMERWAEAYPAVDLKAQLARASEWLLANPAKRKKAVRRFITNWLARAQERGGDVPSNRTAGTPRPRASL